MLEHARGWPAWFGEARDARLPQARHLVHEGFPGSARLGRG